MNLVKRMLKSKLFQNSIWMFLLQMFNIVIPVLTIPYITRVLSKSGYGDFSVAFNWVSYFQVIVEYGFGLSGAKKAAMRKDDEELSNIRGNIIYARLLLLSFCIAILGIIAMFTSIESGKLVCMLILFTSVISLVFQQTWFFQGISEMKNITLISVISRSISVILIFLFVKDANDLYLYCVLNVLTGVIANTISCIVVRKKYNVKAKFNGLAAIFIELKDGWALFISNAMSSLFGTVGVTILGFVAVSEVVAEYSAINKISYVLNMVFYAVSKALYPQSCKAFGESFEYGIKYTKKYAVPIVAFFAACGLVIIAFRDIIVEIAFGSQYANGAVLLIPLIIWTIAGITNNFLGIQTLVASGHQTEYSKAFTISIVVMLILMVIFGYMWNSFGIAFASMCSEILLTLLLVLNIKKIKGLKKI